MTLEQKVAAALAAIKAVFGDMSGNPDDNLEALCELKDEIDIMIEALENNLRDMEELE